MKLSDFDFPIQNHSIAQSPSSVRDQSRLLVLNRKTRRIHHCYFSEIVDFLEPGQVLVLNDTKVFPARLIGQKENGARVEILLLQQRAPFLWEALIKGKWAKFQTIYLKGGLEGRLLSILESGKVLIEFKQDEVSVRNHFLRYGEVPLPPYIKRKNGQLEEDRENYQTVYATHYGSVAAPTAGLHFTQSLLNKIRLRGVEITPLTLHVGLGTFRPVICEEIEAHVMDPETYIVPEETAKIINSAMEENRKIIAVGSTTTRTLETIFNRKGKIEGGRGITRLCIIPGYSFKVVDAIVTNFHLPKSTLLMLVSAFAQRELILQTYETALKNHYRFYSYGDAMLIL